MICKTVNIKRNMPLVSQAMTQLGNEIWMAKYARCHALKVIHGYGSSGQGGAIKAACLKLCADRKKSGVIRHYVRGEDFNPFTADGRKAIELCPQLKKRRRLWPAERRHHGDFILAQPAKAFGKFFPERLVFFPYSISDGLQRISLTFVSSRQAV